MSRFPRQVGAHQGIQTCKVTLWWGHTAVGTHCGDGAVPPHPLLGLGAAQGLICPKLASGGAFLS